MRRRLLAADRRAHGESYVAGGVALGVALETARISRDLDLFHDTLDAVARSWDRDRRTLAAAGYAVDARRERPGYVEATVSKSGQSLIAEWAQDSAFRFFPLVEHPELGLALHRSIWRRTRCWRSCADSKHATRSTCSPATSVFSLSGILPGRRAARTPGSRPLVFWRRLAAPAIP